MIKVLALAIWVLIAPTVHAEGKRAEPGKALAPYLRVSQAHGPLSRLTAYVAVRGPNGRPLSALPADSLSGTLGEKKLEVKEITGFDQAGEGIAYVFLVDVSRSITRQSWKNIQSLIRYWIGSLGPEDRIALVSFGDTVKRVSEFSADKQALIGKLESLQPQDEQTSLYLGLIEGIHLAQQEGRDLPRRRVLVVATDGLDDIVGGATRDEVLHALDVDRIPVFAIGTDLPPSGPRRDQGVKELGFVTRVSGGDYLGPGSGKPKENLAAALRKAIRNVLAVRLACPDCATDGQAQHLELTLSLDGGVVSDGLNIRLLPDSPPPAASPPPSPPPVVPTAPPTREDSLLHTLREHVLAHGWVYGAGGAGLLLVLGVLLALRKREEPKSPTRGPVPSTRRPPISEPPPINLPPLPRTDRVEPPPTPAGPAFGLSLTVLSGLRHGQRFQIRGADEVCIGRQASCEVCISGDSEVSSRHCALFLKAGALMVRDLGSTNGTLVNGVAISEAFRLQEGDVIGVGRTEVRVNFEGI